MQLKMICRVWRRADTASNGGVVAALEKVARIAPRCATLVNRPQRALCG